VDGFCGRQQVLAQGIVMDMSTNTADACEHPYYNTPHPSSGLVTKISRLLIFTSPPYSPTHRP
jgi:hypothetical protein